MSYILDRTREQIKGIEQSLSQGYIADRAYAEKQLETLKRREKILIESNDTDYGRTKIVMVETMEKLSKIDAKNKCARVRFLDWLAAKLHKLADYVQSVSNGIDSPCVIQLPEKKVN